MKTLKDIGRINTTATKLLKLELKAEAVKWFKDAEETADRNLEGSLERHGSIGMMGFIREFFNLTEDDLK